MHPYATDSPERRNIIFGLAVLSVSLAYLLHAGISLLDIQFPWWAESPSMMGIFGLLYQLFEKRLWRWNILRRMGIVRIPDLNGEWSVEGRTTFDSGKNFSASAIIKQTWTKISVWLETAESTSHSISASILIEQPGGITLSYEYRNEPKQKPDVPSTMHAHRGTTVLRLKGKGYELEGEYYSGRDRLNYGTLLFKKVEDRCS